MWTFEFHQPVFKKKKTTSAGLNSPRKKKIPDINKKLIFEVVYDRNHLFGLGSDTETETENWPKLLADTETNRNHKILNWKALHQEDFMSCQLPKRLFSISLISCQSVMKQLEIISSDHL